MTVKRTRELLGDQVKDMTDDEIAIMISKWSAVANVFLDLYERKMFKYQASKKTTRG